MEIVRARSGWRAEVCDTLDGLERALDDLVVRGLSASEVNDIAALEVAAASLDGAGAGHVAARITDVVTRQRGADKGAARAVLQLQTSLRVFERVLTLEAVTDLLAVDEEEDATEDATAPTTRAPQTFTPLPPGEDKKLLPVLDDLCRAVEDLVATGLVTASSATKQKLEVSFKEASRLKLGRLAASLRYVVEEIQRYLDNAPTFSRRRLALFLNRSWVLGRGLSQAIVEKNEAAMGRLLLSASPVAVERAAVVVTGIRKRVPQGTGVVAFDFHARLVEPCGALPAGAPVIWSHIVPRKDVKVMPEALLHLELKPQGLKPIDLAQPKVFFFDVVNLVVDANGGGRLMLTPDTRVRAGDSYDGWDRFAAFDGAAVIARVEAHDVSPLDLEVELAVEVAFADVSVGERVERGDVFVQELLVPFGDSALTVEVNLPKNEETKELAAVLTKMKKQKPAHPLFGVLHFDRCRWVFQPLSLLAEKGPQHLMINLEKIDLKELTKSLF